ncbi:alpha/beta fold hydrolase [Corallococcus llansteffanensis]|uniref:Alpha/beta fold hydrolase n=1 Tax=Corallococcus llansteffanensis TaxID=2316731 RepID=A0A3A8PGY0_9BACT|nr:alpha/beta fold hydrolase [Corallococcus llansteffanensis]RKH55603.1 alpha/beta fold hydrolase [Corallococcus llansteffanensis]
MTDNSMWIPVDGSDPMRAWVHRPESGSGPALLLLMVEAFEGNSHLRHMAQLFAEEGYVVVVPDLASRGEPEEVDLKPVVAYARALPDVTGLKGQRQLGAVGFGLGGTLAAQLAVHAQVDCAVAYCAPGMEDVLAEARPDAAPVVLNFAEWDGFVPPSAVARVRARVTPDVELYVYPGVRHGFFREGSPAYHRPSQMMAHTRTMALLRRVMGPRYDLAALWDKHTELEFAARDADATMATMVAHPYVNSVPVMTGGVGAEYLRRFYANHFVHANPKDTKMIPLSRTVGADRVVDEFIFCFTHDIEMDWMLPGIPPTGKYVEVPFVAVVNFRGDKLYHEHIYWDQATVLVQLGLLNPQGLPVSGAESARKLLDETLPSNTLMEKWDESAPPKRQAG